MCSLWEAQEGQSGVCASECEWRKYFTITIRSPVKMSSLPFPTQHRFKVSRKFNLMNFSFGLSFPSCARRFAAGKLSFLCVFFLLILKAINAVMNFYLCRRRQCSHAVSLTVWDDDGGKKKESRMKKKSLKLWKWWNLCGSSPSRERTMKMKTFNVIMMCLQDFSYKRARLNDETQHRETREQKKKS